MTKRFFSILLLFAFASGTTVAQSNSMQNTLNAFKEDNSRYSVLPININSTNSDFCPFIFNHQLLFASGRESQYGVVYSDSKNDELIDLYVCDKVDSITFKSPNLFSGKINSVYNDGPACFNKENNRIIYTCNSKITPKGNNSKATDKNLQLYSSVFADKNWSTGILLNFCKPEHMYCHPTLSADEKKLFFSSNMPGGYGGMDLYYVINSGDSWSEPINLGPAVNSEKNEVFPFISIQQVLYFSSDSKNGIGGLDIYSFDFSDITNAKVHLLESPLNTPFDDFGIYVDSSGNSGYLSSNRNSVNKDDIYYFRNNYPYFNFCTPFIEPSNCFTFFEESSGTNLQGDAHTSLEYEWNLGDGTKVKGLEAKHCFSKPGNYLIELNIIEKASGAFFYNEVSYEFNVDDSEQVYINAPDTISLKDAANMTAYKSKLPGFSILNFYWNFGDGHYSSGIQGLHKYAKEGTYIINLGILARNDSSRQLKNSCVEKKIVVAGNEWRKRNVNQYAVPGDVAIKYSTKNIDSLNFRVYLGGSTEQIPLNSEVFNNLNDVREFKTDSTFRYTSGESKKVADIMPEFNTAKNAGFKNATVVGFSGDKLLANQERSLVSKIVDSASGSALVATVYFGSGQYNIKKAFSASLDSVVALLGKDPSHSLLLIPSTDPVGKKSYNIKLSGQRADAAKKYFVSKGVKRSRIIIKSNDQHLPENSENITDAGYMRRVSIYLIRN